jgi:hypothetical protein
LSSTRQSSRQCLGRTSPAHSPHPHHASTRTHACVVACSRVASGPRGAANGKSATPLARLAAAAGWGGALLGEKRAAFPRAPAGGGGGSGAGPCWGASERSLRTCVWEEAQPLTSRAAHPYPSSAWLLRQVSPTENNKIGMVVRAPYPPPPTPTPPTPPLLHPTPPYSATSVGGAPPTPTAPRQQCSDGASIAVRAAAMHAQGMCKACPTRVHCVRRWCAATAS